MSMMSFEFQFCPLSAAGGSHCCSTSVNAPGESKPHPLQVVQVLSYSPGLLLPAQSRIHSVPLLLLHLSWRKALGNVLWWMEQYWGTHLGQPWLCSTLCPEGCQWDGWVSPPGRQPEHLGCPQKAAGCPVCGSTATAQAPTDSWHLTRSGKGFYSNHFPIVAGWWIAFAPSFQLAEHFPELIPTGTTSAVAADSGQWHYTQRI